MRSPRRKSRRPRSTLLKCRRRRRRWSRRSNMCAHPRRGIRAESQRGRERGTVLLRVLVDALGRPAQIQIERSSGYSRLDAAARSRGGEGLVPSARSERHRPAGASTHPDRVRPPLDLIHLARRYDARQWLTSPSPTWISLRRLERAVDLPALHAPRSRPHRSRAAAPTHRHLAAALAGVVGLVDRRLPRIPRRK